MEVLFQPLSEVKRAQLRNALADQRQRLIKQKLGSVLRVLPRAALEAYRLMGRLIASLRHVRQQRKLAWLVPLVGGRSSWDFARKLLRGLKLLVGGFQVLSPGSLDHDRRLNPPVDFHCKDLIFRLNLQL